MRLFAVIHAAVIAFASGQLTRPLNCREERDENLSCDRVENVNRYRTFTGRCNNPHIPYRGATRTPMLRLIEAQYEDGQEAPIGFFSTVFYDGVRMPNPRRVSKQVMSANFTLTDSRLTALLVHWGQFLAHDVTLARETDVNCTLFSRDTRSCFNLILPRADQDIRHTQFFPFKRSAACYTEKHHSDHYREQMNQVTSFLDNSQVYGSDAVEALRLRDLTSDLGLMRVNTLYRSATGKSYLPFDNPAQPTAQCFRNLDVQGVDCFSAGDMRVNEQLLLMVLHTLFVREHNRIATRLKDINPHWNGDRLFQEARHIVIAIAQKIHFDDWLPKVVGHNANRLREYDGYQSTVDPTVANAFATAVMRFGHAMMVPVLERYDRRYRSVRGGHISLRDAFFAPEILMFDGGMDPLLRGSAYAPAKEIMGKSLINSELTEHLFPHANHFALDLAALNIQRGRDHALPRYNQYREYCGLPKLHTWAEFSVAMRDPEVVSTQLVSLYSSPDNVDLWVGGLLENPIDDSLLGPTFTCIMIQQFGRLRDGDRFWYENRDIYDDQKVASIKAYSLAKLICNSADAVDSIQADVFKQDNNLKRCDLIADLDLRPWTDRDEFQRRPSAPRPLQEEPFECESDACACRYKPGSWSSCDPARKIRTRIDTLLVVQKPGHDCPSRRQLFRSCHNFRPRNSIARKDDRFFNEFRFRFLARNKKFQQ